MDRGPGDQQYRYQLLNGILRKHQMIEEEIRSGQRTRHRSRTQILQMKSEKIGKHANTWFLRGTHQNTFKVQGTPDSGLLEAIKKSLDKEICTEGGSTKFVELGGKPVASGLSKPVSFTANNGCVFAPPCNIDPEMDCRVPRAVYEVECMQCAGDEEQKRNIYLGTTGHMLHKRQREHMGEVRQMR